MTHILLLSLALLIPSIGLPQPSPLPYQYGLTVLHREGFTVGYNTQFRVAAWTLYRMDSTLAACAGYERTRFRPDPLLEGAFQAIDADYRNSGFDRGHIVPSEDMDCDSTAHIETYYFTNCFPQDPALNRGLWANLERKVRDYALRKSLFVITGCIVAEGDSVIGASHVVVPSFVYKIVVSEDYSECAAYLLPNIRPAGRLKDYRVTVAQLERMSGVRFFSNLGEHTRTKLGTMSNLQL